MSEGYSLIRTGCPIIKQYAGAPGLIKPKWDSETTAWVEAATEEEIEVWEAEHPAPEIPEPGETLESRVDALEAA